MSIQVETRDASVEGPVVLELVNSSGANVEVFVFIGDGFDLRHAFDFKNSTATFSVSGLAAGAQSGTVIVRAIKNLNRMYSVLFMLNGEIFAVADGNIDTDSGRDSGSGNFTVTVGGVQ